jgi:uncharacterized lipoprotein YajG
MQIVKRGLFWMLAAVLAGGCAWVRQSATLKLEPVITPSQIGNGVRVAVRVIDRRPSATIGYRGVDSKNAAITTGQDVAALFQEKLIEGLKRKGFDAFRYEGAPGRLLTVEVRLIDYSTDMEFWKGLVKVQAELVALVPKDGVRFEQTYFVERKETTVEAPRAKTNERLINSAISGALQKLFDDARLMAYLAG